MTKKIAIIIPARMASTRLPNKPLADILGKSMIQRVYEKALESKVGAVYVACDGEEIAAEVAKFGGKSILTDAGLESGTDRVYAALQKITEQNFDLIINLQGDLPNIDPKVIKAAADAALNNDADISTVASVIKNHAEINDPNVVKIAIAFNDEKYGENCGRALYFSRLPIPYDKNQEAKYYHHIGIYAFKPASLAKFVALKPTEMARRESLEQLRALENDMKIVVNIVDAHPLSVDTQQDLDNIIKEIEAQYD